MRVAVVTDSISRRAGGLFSSVMQLTIATARNGFHMKVFAGEDRYSSDDKCSWNDIEFCLSKVFGPRSFGFQTSLVEDLRHFSPNVIHQHGIWMYPSVCTVRMRNSGVPSIISPHGMLDRWALENSRWKKQLARLLYENRNLAGATCLRALCSAELAAIRDFGLSSPVAVIPNGIDLPRRQKIEMPEPIRMISRGKKILFFLGRIHPKKGLTSLISAWKICRNQNNSAFNDWILVISGWDQGGHEDELKKLCTKLGLNDCVKFVGPSFNEDKSSYFHHSDAFILPSHSEGLPMVVLEAWSFSLPVLMTPQCNIPEGFVADAAIRIEPTVDGIVGGLQCLFGMDSSARSLMGERGYSLVKDQFQWNTAGADLCKVYQWMAGAGERPDCVVL